MKDVNGKEITVGCKVRRAIPPNGLGNGNHAFMGVSEVVSLELGRVHVKSVNKEHIPVHCPELVEVVESA